ncbi:hypothetical protein [Mucilaginibacter jinjuensis]|uniref:Deacetylase PdaC domain-containing protein n=1 Tax=Mucilaginibacter jinjuensis TaxID=1176721 RepID=A0ABY7T6X2_9SPHI|nr:hypothetical protein [Mucilaginibacter jinjuensis]WCT12101.1 hypothetical protein PQO05_25575 [Mucilaginibacter jinjuensis]
MKYCLLAILFLMAYQTTYAQTKPGSDIIISTKTVFIHYQGQKDSLMFPEVSTKYPALTEALSPKNLLQGDKLEDVVANYQKCGCGITGVTYSVGFVNADVISIEIYYNRMDDHPTSFGEWLTLDVHTGKPFTLDNEITQAGVDYLTARYKKWLTQNINDEKIVKEDEDAQKDVYDDLLNSTEALTPKVITSDYIFADKGILLKTDTVLPQEAQDHEPNRVLLITYAQLKPYIKSTSVVLKNIHK